MATMNVVRFHKYGEPSVLEVEEVPIPDIGPHEVLIETEGIGLNPVDWKTRRGHGAAKVIESLPMIPGWDVSGTVREVGAGVHRFDTGDEVYGMVSFPRQAGGYAEYIAAEARDLAFKPRNISHEEAAAVPLASLTAWQALFEVGHLFEGQQVLIQAAAGGVGHFAVQFAKWKDARVIGTSSQHEEFLIDLGIDEVIDYRNTPFESAVENMDLVLDGVGDEVMTRSMKVLRTHGVLVTIPTSLTDEQKREAVQNDVFLNWFLVEPERHQLGRITELIERGLVSPHIDTVYSMDDVRSAHKQSESGHTCGKIVMVP